LSKTETVNIPKATADFIRKQDIFKLYDSLDDFVMEAIRVQLRKIMKSGIMK
jgi:hypothetical protein